MLLYFCSLFSKFLLLLMKYQNLWPAIQADVLSVIAADDFLGTRAGVAIEPGDITSKINEKLARIVGAGLDGKQGVGYLVMAIEKASDDNPAVPGGPLKLTITIQWVENVIINNSAKGTGTPIRVYAASCVKLLKLYTPVGLTQNLVPAVPAIREFTDNTQKSLRVGMVEFTAIEADFKPFLRVNRPQIVVAGAVVPVTNGTMSYQLTGPATVTVIAPDAGIIYYTTDGSHPYAGNAAAEPYAGPVTIENECLFRCRGFAPGKSGSDTAAANFFTL